jgi:hypothetical protein
MVQPLRAGDVHRHGELGTQPAADMGDAPPCRGWADQCLGDLQSSHPCHTLAWRKRGRGSLSLVPG